MPIQIYHLTHINNLRSILEDGGLRAYNALRQTGRPHTSVAYEGIQERRNRTIVPCGPCGTLHDYVPFYFAPRSPMLYTIHRGNVAGYAEGQSPLAHIVSTIESIQAAGLKFVFTDGHAIMEWTDFYDDLSKLDQIDWEVMNSLMWRDTATDLDRKRRRQAEFLIYGFFPWNLITEIGVINNQVRARVETVLQGTQARPLVTIRQNWYYG
jgi:hypothetical protein